ncbi:MAG: hypothetical protein K4571_10965 [Deltaproteobacteria bacterium]
MQGQDGHAGGGFISSLKGFYLQNPRAIRRIGFVILLILFLTWLTCINMCGYLGILGHATWKEEVLLHDGSKIVVKRWQKRMNVYTLEKSALLKEQSLSFKRPKTGEKIVWNDGPTEGIRTANFKLIALHIKNDTPYLITQNYGCFSYNRWGRPNPPYVIFKYEDKKWKRIPLEELPPEFENVNLVMSIDAEEILAGPSLIPAEMVKKSNDRFHRPLFRAIVRAPMEFVGCEELVYDGRGGWCGIDYFSTKSSYEACVTECKKVLFDMQYCPCDRLFEDNNKVE